MTLSFIAVPPPPPPPPPRARTMDRVVRTIVRIDSMYAGACLPGEQSSEQESSLLGSRELGSRELGIQWGNYAGSE